MTFTLSHTERAVSKLASLPLGSLPGERHRIVQEAIDAALSDAGFGRSAMRLTYRLLHGEESSSRYGAFGVRILVANTHLPDFDNRDLDNESALEKAIHHAGYDAAALVKAAVMAHAVSKSPEARDQRVAERADIVGLFVAPVFVAEVPNGYCSDWCCRHLPWFKVTTSVGPILIGWRKRVLSIDWTETVGTKTSAELFADEDVTKETRLIHAWSLVKARAYVEAIVGSATP